MNRITIVRLPIITLCFLFLFIGCTTMQGFKNTIVQNNHPLLKKRVLLAPINIQADMDQERIQQLNTVLLNLLKKDAHLIVLSMEKLNLSHDKMESLQFGAGFDPVLAETIQKLRIDVLITAVLSPIDIITEKKGFLFFKKEKSEAVIYMMINALDITTGTVLANHLESQEIKLPTVITEGQEKQVEIESTLLDNAMSSILSDLVKTTSDILNQKPWMGRLATTDSGALRINAGRDIGIYAGGVFEVFREGEPIRNLMDKEQMTLGTKVGEIKINEVMPDYSIADPLSGEGFMNGQIVRIKNF